MAQLGKDYPFPTFEDFPDWKDYGREADKAFSKIPEDRVIEFPVADGTACYYVGSLKPLVLRHIPAWDMYEIPIAHIRGLRTEDVEQMIARKKAFNELFEQQIK